MKRNESDVKIRQKTTKNEAETKRSHSAGEWKKFPVQFRCGFLIIIYYHFLLFIIIFLHPFLPGESDRFHLNF